MSDIESEYSEGAESGNSDDDEISQQPTKKVAKKIIRNPDDSDVSEAESDEESHADDSYVSEDDDIESLIEEDELYEDPIEKKKAAKKREEVPEYVFDLGDESSDEEAETEYGSNYLQKLGDEMKHDVILDYHPELVQHNYEEVEALSTIVYDQYGIISDPLHQTLPFLTKYEKARILGERAKQINGGSKPFVDLGPEIMDGFVIASAELEQKKIPFIIRRPLLNGGCEYWKLRDLEQI